MLHEGLNNNLTIREIYNDNAKYICKLNINISTDICNNTMTIDLESRLNANGFKITISKSDGFELFNKAYSYGLNASYSRQDAEQAKKDYKRFGSSGHWYYQLRPYTSDIILDLCKEYNVSANNIQIRSGKNVFKGTKVDDETVKDFIDTYMSDIIYNSINQDNIIDLFNNYYDAIDVALKVNKVLVYNDNNTALVEVETTKPMSMSELIDICDTSLTKNDMEEILTTDGLYVIDIYD